MVRQCPSAQKIVYPLSSRILERTTVYLLDLAFRSASNNGRTANLCASYSGSVDS